MPDSRCTALDTYDIGFPTSGELDGSDAMNPDPDYSAAYLVLRSDAEDGLEERGFVITIGRGNDVQIAAINALREHILGLDVDEVCADPASLNRALIGDNQLRWLGPEQGVMHITIGALVNAVWDLAAKRARVPLVAGGASGIGQTTARLPAARGADVAVLDLDVSSDESARPWD